MANVQVMGMQREAGGLKESLAKTRKHNADVANALLNVSGIGTATGQEVDQDEDRPAYVHQQWPMMVYHVEGKDLVVVDAEGLERAKAKGYRVEPWPAVHVLVEDPKREKQALMDTNIQLQAQITKQADEMSKMQATLEKLLAAKN